MFIPLLTCLPYLLLSKTKKRYRTYFLLSCLLFFLFFYYRLVCPVYNGSVFTQLSENRNPVSSNIVRPWGDTFSCQPTKILFPNNVNEIQTIVETANHVRVVGSGHSFSPLICSYHTLISLEKMNNIVTVNSSTVIVEAGITLETLLSHLIEKEDKLVYGFGSIQDQTVGGAFMTSHHGLTFNSFAEKVVQIKVVLASGLLQTIDGDELKYWRSSMGMLGIVVEMEIELFKNSFVQVSKQKMSLSDAIKQLPLADAGIIETNYNQKKHGLLKYITILGNEESKQVAYPVETNHFTSLVWDTFVIPFTILFPIASTFPLLDITNNGTNVAPMATAWTHHSEYGMMYSAYAIPISSCFDFIQAIDTSTYNHDISTLLVRYVSAQENTTCLTFAQTNSCVVDVYDLSTQPNIEKFHVYLESLAHSFQGMSHWGKYYAGDIERQVNLSKCYKEFKIKQQELDPNNKFLNNYTNEILFGQKNAEARYGNTFSMYRTKTILYQILFTLVMIVSLYLCCTGYNDNTQYSRVYGDDR